MLSRKIKNKVTVNITGDNNVTTVIDDDKTI